MKVGELEMAANKTCLSAYYSLYKNFYYNFINENNYEEYINKIEARISRDKKNINTYYLAFYTIKTLVDYMSASIRKYEVFSEIVDSYIPEIYGQEKKLLIGFLEHFCNKDFHYVQFHLSDGYLSYTLKEFLCDVLNKTYEWLEYNNYALLKSVPTRLMYLK